MPLNRGYTDEIKVLTAQPVIGAAKGENFDTSLGRVAKHIDSPLRLYASVTPDAVLNIGSNVVELGDGAGKITPPVSSSIGSFAASTINMQTGVTTGGTIKLAGGASFTLPASTLNYYRRMCFSLLGSTLYVAFSPEAATLGALENVGATFVSLTGLPAGFMNIQCTNTSGAYKTADSSTNIIENKVGSAIAIYRFGSGGAGGSSGGGAGASLLDANYDETFIYYTRSDFSIDKATFFGSTTGTDAVSGAGKITLGIGQNFISSNLLGPVYLADNPVLNSAQVRLLYNTGKSDPLAVVSVSADGGTTWTASVNEYSSGNFVIADFNFATGTTSTNLKIKVVSATAASELVGFGVNMVQDAVTLLTSTAVSTSGTAAFEPRTITSTEASTGTITLALLNFVPGAHQLRCNYNGHDFMAPVFTEMGGNVVQFPANYFVTGDAVIFNTAYGIVNSADTPIDINSFISNNSTSGNVTIPLGYTLEKPFMDVPSGATISGAGNIETSSTITGAGVLASSGVVISKGFAPTQPKFDSIQEATATKGVTLQGRTDGSRPSAGSIGEYVYAAVTTGTGTSSINTDTDVVGLSILLTPGVWMLYYNVAVELYNNSGSASSVRGRVRITDSSNNPVTNTEAAIGFDNAPNLVDIITSASRMTTVSISTATTYKIRIASGGIAGTSITVNSPTLWGGLTDPDNQSVIAAVRIA